MTMLPDKIEIRPGITATIGGTQMTSKDAVLASTYPRILAGYPKVKEYCAEYGEFSGDTQ